MLNKSHRSVVSTCVLIFMPYLKKKTRKNNKKQFFSKKKKHLFILHKKHDLKKTVFFTSLVATQQALLRIASQAN